METIAGECGLGNVNSMRTVFQRALKIAPGQYRRHFRQRAARKTAEAQGDNAETDFLLACLDDLTTPVRSKTPVADFGPPRPAETNFILFRCGLLPFPRTSY